MEQPTKKLMDMYNEILQALPFLYAMALHVALNTDSTNLTQSLEPIPPCKEIVYNLINQSCCYVLLTSRSFHLSKAIFCQHACTLWQIGCSHIQQSTFQQITGNETWYVTVLSSIGVIYMRFCLKKVALIIKYPSIWALHFSRSLGRRIRRLKPLKKQFFWNSYFPTSSS